jgi:uncharacterized SAM-binding protein YcdF (DUF218 family)
MRDALREDFGLRATWLETRSRNTRENAEFSAAMLKAAGVATVALVTDDNHMRRASLEFAAAGMRVTPAPIHIPRDDEAVGWWGDISPSARTLRRSSLAIYEMLGQLKQWFGPRGREPKAPASS